MTPDKHTNRELFVEVSDGHELYVHDWGNKDADQIIFYIHGGPGSGCSDKYKGGFDPLRQRVIFHDQRGSGRSLPYGSLEHNTIQDLIADISKIADKLDIKKFILTGGSWGSSLSLAYGIAHPERVIAMVLDGIWTCTQFEIDWLAKAQFQTFFPDAWQAYVDGTPEEHRHDPSAYHFKRALSDDQQASKESGYLYQNLEGAVMRLDDRQTPTAVDEFDPAGIRIEIHYLVNGCFMPDRFILDNSSKLTMPIYLVQGRYDMVCPPVTAYELHRCLPRSELIFTTSGHAGEHETWSIKRTILLELCK